VECVREHVENGRAQLHELIFGDPAEPYRREGLALPLASSRASSACSPVTSPSTLQPRHCWRG
jgi:hypothetical protein